MIELSVVAPVYNEAAILPELARRCVDAAKRTGMSWEVLLVDDGSTDDTRQVAASLPGEATIVHLPHNVGQLGATMAGLRAARGGLVIVLDGDLQDPPEVITTLAPALVDGLDVVFATKASRDDPAWFRLGRLGYSVLLALPGSRAVPPGAGAYCVMRSSIAHRLAELNLRHGNLSALLVALGVRFDVIHYDKVARYDGESRIGAIGLAREAVASLALTGALAALAGWSAVACGLIAALLPELRVALLAAAALLLVAALALRRRTRKTLAPRA